MELPKPDDVEADDISQSLNGNRAVVGKVLYSANRQAQSGDRASDEKHEKQEAQDRESRELMHLAVWNAEKTIVGGVEMTNEEAQNARQRIIDNDEFFADRAVKQGRIGVDEKEEYKETIRRIKELEDRKGRGTISQDEERECERLKLSRVGRAAEHDAGAVHAALNGQKISADSSADDAKAAIRPTGGAVPDSTLFQAAPELSESFAQAKAATTPLDSNRPAPLAPKVAATGLNL